MNILLMLPKLFRTGQLIAELLRGEITQEKVKAIVDELFGIVSTIPQLQAFMGLIQVVFKVAHAIIPVLTKGSPSTEIQSLLTRSGITSEDLEAASNVMEVFKQLEDRLAADADKLEQAFLAMPDQEQLEIV